MLGIISAAYAGGVLAFACFTTWVILYLHREDKLTRELAWATYGILWLMAVMLFMAKLFGI